MLKEHKNTVVAFLFGAVVTAGGAALYFSQADPGAGKQLNVSAELFPTSPSPSLSPLQFPASSMSPAQGKTGLDDVPTMIHRLAQRLERDPDNPDGWRMLGWSYLATDEAQKAVAAYAKAIELKGDDAEYRSAYGEALVKAANGKVTLAAKAAFDSSLAIEPSDARARYYVGLAKKQGGDSRGAFDIWSPLMKEVSPEAPIAPDLRSQMASVSAKLGLETPSGAQPSEIAAQADRAPEAAPASPGGEMARILGMVKGLAQRLKDDPEDADGWRMLGKSYGVLGNDEGSVQAYARLIALRPDDPSARQRHAEALLKTVKAGEQYPASLTNSLNWLYESNPKDEFSLFHLGEANSRAGKKEEAAKYWQSLVDILPKDSLVRTAVLTQLRAQSKSVPK